MFIESVGDGSVYVDTLHYFLVDLLNFLVKGSNHFLEFLLVVLLLPLVDEELVQLEVAAVPQCVHLNIF